jgi:hypothetical protein
MLVPSPVSAKKYRKLNQIRRNAHMPADPTRDSPIRDSLLIGDLSILAPDLRPVSDQQRIMNRRHFLARTASCAAAPLLACSIALPQAEAQSTNGRSRITNVIELFTSQGCSSCPSADALLEGYAKRPDVLALSFSVDYWDYLGWKDTLASAKFTKRQRVYAQARGDGQVYTPQMVINGTSHVVGSNKSAIDAAMVTATSSAATELVSLKLQAQGQHLVIECEGKAANGAAKDATLWLVHVTRRVDVPIKRGENSGKTITYHNVVREMTPIGMWSGQPLTVKLERHAITQPGGELYAVLLQQGQAGPIIGAATIPVW